MMKDENDTEAWEAYPQYRWVFNKLELALKLGYEAGPACVPVKKAGWYIVKPIYNLYGMGIGATKKYLDPIQHEEILDHKHIPPGYFWCEYLEGPHYSIDFKRIFKKPFHEKWEPVSATLGTHINDDNLVRFEKWTFIEIPDIKLPEWINCYNLNVKNLNIEFKGDKPFEIHLRLGNEEGDIGDEIYPIWNTLPYLHYEFAIKEELEYHSENEDLKADGHLKDVRLGYYIRRKKNT